MMVMLPIFAIGSATAAGDLRQLFNDHLQLTRVVHLGQRLRLLLKRFGLREAQLLDRLCLRQGPAFR